MLSEEALAEFLNQMQDIGRRIIGGNATGLYLMQQGFISQKAAAKAAEDGAIEAQLAICLLVRRYFGGDRKEPEHAEDGESDI